MAKPVDVSKTKYKNGISQTAYEKGINAVNTNPAAEAVKHKDAYEKNTIAGEAKMLRNISKISIADWKNATKASFSKLQEKVVNAIDNNKYPASKVLEAGKAAHEIVKDMPRGTYAQSYERFAKAIETIKSKYK